MSNVVRLPQVPALSWDDCKLLVDGVEDYAIFMLDVDGRVATWNRGAQRLKGYSADEIVGRSFETFYPPADLASDKPRRLLAAAREQGHVEDEGWRVRKDGSLFWASVVITVLREEGGALRGYAKVTRDLTDRRAAEEQLRRSEERLRLLIESVTDYAIYMLDPTGVVTTWNVGAERIKGYATDEIIGRHFSVFFPVEALQAGKPAQELEEASRTGRFEEEGWRLKKDGSRFWASVVVTAMRDAKGELTGFAKVTRDLTDRRAADDELRRSEERLRLMVESVSDYAIYMLDPSGHVSSWNEGAQRIKGYKPDEIMGRHLSVFFPEDAVQAKNPEQELELARQVGRFEEEGWRVRKNGSRFWASVVITPIRDVHGKLLGFAKVTRDLTGRLAAEESQRKLEMERAARAAAEASEERLRQANALSVAAAAKAEEANRIKDQFISMVSHELRTPLNAIMGWASILRRGADDQRMQRGVEVIHRNAAAQAKLIDDMLDVARIVSGKLHVEMTRTDVVSVVQHAIESVRLSASDKKQQIQLHRGNEQLMVSADALRIQQVVWNLLNNAVKFSPAGGLIDVAVEASATEVSITISDTGPGVDPQFVPQLFDAFQQADMSSSRSAGGLGLGLAIAKHIITLHGGKIAYLPGVPRGSTFLVALPLCTDDLPVSASAAVARQDSGRALEGRRIVAVDDSADALDLLRTGLEDQGCIVQTAHSAEEALELINSFRPFALVSDLGMPGRDGHWLIRQVRQWPLGEHLPAVAVSAYTQPSDRVRSRAAGYDAHLGKPVDLDELVALLVAWSKKPPSR